MSFDLNTSEGDQVGIRACSILVFDMNPGMLISGASRIFMEYSHNATLGNSSSASLFLCTTINVLPWLVAMYEYFDQKKKNPSF